MFHNNPTKSDCSKKQTKKFKPFKGKINFFTERRSFHLNFFQTGNKNFSKNFNFFFGPNAFTFAGSLPVPEGTPHSCKHPHPTLHTWGDLLPHPKPRGAIPTPTTAKSWEYRQLPKHWLQQTLLISHFMSFLPLPLVLRQAGTSPPCPHAQITRAVDFNFTSSGLS